MTHFDRLIMDWYRQNSRDLPWRMTNSPYKIWLSEIVLQQTRVDQGLQYYLNLLQAFPTVQDLALAQEQEVLNLWQGLGYYSRARNLHQTAKIIVKEYNGVFPDSYLGLLKLKGIGPYTAAAIASFAYKEPVAVVDGNVYRVLSRVFDIHLPIDSTEGKKYYQQMAQSLLNIEHPDVFNQAIMEFGALQCIPKNPSCENCALRLKCLALANGTIEIRPTKVKKVISKDRFFHFFIFLKDSKLYIQKRKQKDIWKHLYQFPMIETIHAELTAFDFPFGELLYHHRSEILVHKLTHQKLHAVFYHFSCFPAHPQSDWILIHKDLIHDFPLSRLIDKYLQEHSNYF